VSLPTPQLLVRISSIRAKLMTRLRSLNEEGFARTGVHPKFGSMSLSMWLEFFLVHEAHQFAVGEEQLMTRRTCFVCTLLMIIAGKSYAQTPVPAYRARMTMAQCRTVTALQKAHGKSGVHDKVTELVFFSRWLSLSPQNTGAAHGVLQNIPATEKEAVDLMTLSDPPEDINAPNTVMFALGSIHDQWPQLVARAALRFPEGMKSYVAFLPLATIDIHSNFTGTRNGCVGGFQMNFA
jgi:hypothetical protein